jgi:acetyl esterase/lipase
MKSANKYRIVLIGCVFAISNLVTNGQIDTIKVWSGGIPSSIFNAGYKEAIITPWGDPIFEKVTDPEIYVFLPPAEKATGTAVLICPGGGYGVVCTEHEGVAIAKWLNESGIVGIVLKYRLPSDKIMKDKSIGPLQDVQEAMRIIRRNAAKWNVDAEKVGVMGFSAGGHLASTLSTHFDEIVYKLTDTVSARPDFSILIYPVVSMQIPTTHLGSREALLGINPDSAQIIRFSNELQITSNTPPAFLVHASDDGSVPVQNSIGYYQNLVKFEIPAEMHIYEKGDHGFGLGQNSNGTASEWPAASIKWLNSNGW